MSSAALVATAIILVSQLPTSGPPDVDPLASPEAAVNYVASFGGREIRADDPMKPYCPPPPDAGTTPPAGRKGVKFYNSHFTDLDLAAVAESLSQIIALEVLDLSYTRVKGESLGWLARFPSFKLKELNLSSTPISGVGLRELARLDALECIRLNQTTLYLSDLLAMQGMMNTRLKALHLSGARLLDHGMQPLKPEVTLKYIAGFTYLEDLDLAGTLAAPGSPGEKGVGDLKPLGGLKYLKRLDLSNNKLQAPDDPPKPPKPGVKPKPQAVAELVKLTKLTTLRLGGNGDLNDKSFEQIWSTPAVPVGVHKLTRLDLSGTKLTDKGVKGLASHNRKLVDLNISNTPTMVHKDAPDGLRGLACLCTLNLAGTGLGDTMFVALGKGSGLASVRSLDISGTMVTNKGLATDSQHIVVPFRGPLMIYYADTKVTAAGVNHRNALAALAGDYAELDYFLGNPPSPTPSSVESKLGRMR
jgi:hypothetical protein